MGLVGIFKMTSASAKTADSVDLKEQECDLAEAYARSASQDKKIAEEFDATLADGLVGVQKIPKDADAAL